MHTNYTSHNAVLQLPPTFLIKQKCQEICQFLDRKAKDATVFSRMKSGNGSVTRSSQRLNPQFQGRDHMITDMRDAVEPFQVKLLSSETSDAEPSQRNEILIRHVADKLSTLSSHLRGFSDEA